VIHGLLRTAHAGSRHVNTGAVVFTALGFAGLYLLLSILFVFQVLKEITRGPVAARWR
jgi:cytochrome d ubiquinol oxidase subunit I